MRSFLGIDPGQKGGIAIIFPRKTTITQTSVIDMPTIGKEIDVKAVIELLENTIDPVVIIEIQKAFPKQGATSGFTNGFNYGLLLGALKALGKVKIIRVLPGDWKREMLRGLNKNDKALSIARARELFPKMDIPKSKDGRAEALLLAEYGRRLEEGQLMKKR